MGILDLPAVPFGWFDQLLSGVLSPGLRVAIWGVLGGVASMLLYRMLSQQQRIADIKADVADARARLEACDSDLADAWPIMRQMLGRSAAQIGHTGWPALIASVPLLCLLGWISTQYGYSYPARADAPRIDTVPGELITRWIAPGEAGDATASALPRIRVGDTEAHVLAEVALSSPVTVIHQWQWWNVLIGNPVGYLPRDAGVQRIDIALPRREYLPFGPSWLRGWEPVFFAALLTVSIVLKLRLRIQ